MSGTRAISTTSRRELSSIFFFLQGKAPKEIHAILTETLIFFLPGRAKDLSASLYGRLRLKRDGTLAETRFRLPAKRTSPFKSAGASVQSTTGSRGVRISFNNAGYTMFQGSVKDTG